MAGKRDIPRPRVDFIREQRLALYELLEAREAAVFFTHYPKTGKVSQFR